MLDTSENVQIALHLVAGGAIGIERSFRTMANMSYRTTNDGASFEYRMIIRTGDEANTGRLAGALRALAAVREFRISPTGD